MDEQEKDMEQLEAAFQKAYDEVHDQIQLKLAQASKLIEEAVKLSEEHGVPFRPEKRLMFCKPSYIPESLSEKFPDLDTEFISEITDAYGYGDYPGWQQSQVC
jgi:hypothetical protein